MNELLCVYEVAKILNIKENTVRIKIRKGILKAQKIDRRLYVERQEVNRLIQTYKKKAGNPNIKYMGNF